MAINFPDSPSNNDLHTVSGVTWKWDGTTWLAQGGTQTYNNYQFTVSGSTATTGNVQGGGSVSIGPVTLQA